MAEAVVHDFEAVEVEEQNGHGCFGRAAQRVLEPVGEQCAVGQPGEGVLERLAGELLLVAQSLADVPIVQDEGTVIVSVRVGQARNRDLEGRDVPARGAQTQLGVDRSALGVTGLAEGGDGQVVVALIDELEEGLADEPVRSVAQRPLDGRALVTRCGPRGR